MSVGIVMDSQTVVELDSQDIFIRIRILGSEEIQVVRFRMSGRVQLVRTIIDNLAGSFGSQIQVIRIIVAFQLQVVILAVRTSYRQNCAFSASAAQRFTRNGLLDSSSRAGRLSMA